MFGSGGIWIILFDRHFPGMCTSAVFQQKVPDGASGIRIHSWCGFIQKHHFSTSNKSHGNRKLPLHTTYIGRQHPLVISHKSLSFFQFSLFTEKFGRINRIEFGLHRKGLLKRYLWSNLTGFVPPRSSCEGDQDLPAYFPPLAGPQVTADPSAESKTRCALLPSYCRRKGDQNKSAFWQILF